MHPNVQHKRVGEFVAVDRVEVQFVVVWRTGWLLRRRVRWLLGWELRWFFSRIARLLLCWVEYRSS